METVSANVVPFPGREPVSQQLISRLQRVTQVQPDRWRAICPAHESKHLTQSLAIRELAGGTLLIKCFAGCGAADVVAAVGLEFKDLFPPQLTDGKPFRPNLYHAAREALQTLHKEVFIVLVAAEQVHRGESLNSADLNRLAQTISLIRSAAEACR
jgi:hypothetical protein